MDLKELEAISNMLVNFHLVCVVIIFIFMSAIIVLIILRVRKHFSFEERLYRKLKEYMVYSCNESLYEQRYHEDEIHNVCVRNEYILVDKTNKYKISITEKGMEALRILSNNNDSEKLFNRITILLTIMTSLLVFCVAYSNWKIQIINIIK